MGLLVDTLPSPHQSRMDFDNGMDSGRSPAGASQHALDDAKINYLKMMMMTLLDELSSLTQGRREPARRRIDLKEEVLRFESELIRSALQTTHGQQRRAARLLGTNATTLNTKLKRLKIGIDEEAPDSFALAPASEIGFSHDDGHPLTFAEAMDRYEIDLIRNALIHTGGNQSKAARLLGLPITTLNSKIKKFKIELPGYSSASMTGFGPADSHREMLDTQRPHA